MLHGQMNRPFELYIPTIIFTKNNRLDSAAQARYPPKRRPRTSSISATTLQSISVFPLRQPLSEPQKLLWMGV